MGKIYTFFPVKPIFVAIVVVFEIGSIVCAAAPSSIAFIIGRAIAGIGSAGNIAGAQLILVDILPLRKRPKYQGLIGATFGLASILGPILGGIFTTNLTWRWCFWINVPIGGVALAGLLFLVPYRKAPQEYKDKGFVERVKRFDPIGTVVLIPGLICVLLALQWGGNLYAWRDARVIAPLATGTVLLVIFGFIQSWVGDFGTVPPRILRQRSITACTVVAIGFGAALVILSFYLPIWFQAIKGLSASDAGIRLLSYFLASTVFVIISGVIVSKTGYYNPWLIGGTAILMVGCGLLTTRRVDTTTAQSVGYQVSGP
jgi:MFS family permease